MEAYLKRIKLIYYSINCYKKNESKEIVQLDEIAVRPMIETLYPTARKWDILIAQNTMVDPKKNRVNDGILFPKESPWERKKHGVFQPGNAQEDILPITEDPKISAKFAIVKVSYVRRLRMASYTDHFPVYVYVKKPSKFTKKEEEEKKGSSEKKKKKKEKKG